MTLKPKSVVRERAGAIRRAIADVMQTLPDRAEFIDRMRGHGIETVTRINAAGRLYGITFIDDANGITVNGSRLGKGFAASVFNAYFAGGANPFIDEDWPKEKEERGASALLFKKEHETLRVQPYFSKRNTKPSGFSLTFQKGTRNPQGSALLFKKEHKTLRVRLYLKKSSAEP